MFNTFKPYPKWKPARIITGLAVLLLLLGLTVKMVTAQGPVIYVDNDAPGSNTGSNWTHAYRDLQSALSATTPGDEIWVAAGVYTPGTTINDSFSLVPGVALYGGFAATETLRTERDWLANPTILSGDIGGDDTHTNGVVLTTTHLVGDNSYHVIFADATIGPAITETTVLDGFTITAGQANDNNNFPHDAGGGFHCAGNGPGSECSPTLNNLIFSGNYAQGGGAIFNDGSNNGLSNPTLSHVTFAGNSADFGGAMVNFGDSGTSSPSLSNVTFSGNSATLWGGAMYNFGEVGNSSPTLNNVSFSGNSASMWGGAMFNDGTDSGNSSPTLTNVTFDDNWAFERGGAIYNDGGHSGNSSPTLNTVTFFNNATQFGGAMLNFGEHGISSPTLHNVIFSGNSASISGGAMLNFGEHGISSPTLHNVIFSGNTAASEGGAIINVGGSGNGNSSPTLTNVTFFGNSASDDGGAIINYGDGGTSSPTLNNVILWGNTAGNQGAQLYNFHASPALSYTLIQSNINDIVNISSTVTYGPNILTDDPLFIDPTGSDGITGTLDDDLRLAPRSPAIDAGDNNAITATTDLAGNPRFFDDGGVLDTGSGSPPLVDLGAYERQHNSLLPEIALSGNGIEIPSDDTTPSPTDQTDFGTVNLNGEAVTRTFTIANNGTADLLLTGTPAVTLLTGTHFSITAQPASPVISHSTTLFQITFDPTAAGTFTDTVSIANNDPDETPYTFDIAGTGVATLLTVTKVITNDNGGTLNAASVPLFVDGIPVNSGDILSVTVGTHTFTETQQPGYTASYGGDCDAGGQVTLALGDSKSCILYNDDQETDAAGVTINTGDGLSLSEASPNDTYTVVLNTQPVATVTIVITPDNQLDLGSGVGNAISLTFTPLNWQTEQTVTVAAHDDALVEGGHQGQLTHSATSNDSGYNGATATFIIDGVTSTGSPLIYATITDNDIPVAGLQATNDSPTTLGHPTTFTATVSRGSDISYTWDFGDGSHGSGATVSHTYATAGNYTATLTATNNLSTQVATTTVTITESGSMPDQQIYLPLIIK